MSKLPRSRTRARRALGSRPWEPVRRLTEAADVSDTARRGNPRSRPSKPATCRRLPKRGEPPKPSGWAKATGSRVASISFILFLKEGSSRPSLKDRFRTVYNKKGVMRESVGSEKEPQTASGGVERGVHPPVIYYDGHCGFCDRAVQWVLRRDRQRIFRFAPLQGPTAAGRFGEPEGNAEGWTLLLEDEAGVHERSDAALRIMARLGGLYTAARVLLWVPRGLRDGVYRWFARNRYRWFGTVDACRIPSSEERELFLP